MSEGHAVVSGQAQVWTASITEVLGDLAVAGDMALNGYHTPFLQIMIQDVSHSTQFVTHVPEHLFLREQMEWEEYDYRVVAATNDSVRYYQLYSWFSTLNGASGGWVYQTTSNPLELQTWRRANYDVGLLGHANSTWQMAALHEVQDLGTALTLDARDGLTNESAYNAGRVLPLSAPLVIERINDSRRQKAISLSIPEVSSE